MRYPKLQPVATSRKMVDTFRGYNHNIRIGDGEMYDMRNLTSDQYPVLSPRKKRGFYVKPASPQGMIAKEELCYVDGTAFVMGNTRVEMELSTAAEDCPKRLVSMGAFVIILPDKKYINTKYIEDRGDIEASFTSSGEVSFQLSTVSGEIYGDVSVGPDAPADAENLDYWIDTSETPNVLRQYSEISGMWIGIATTYVKISAKGIGKNFEQYDGINISGVKSEKLQDLNASAVIWEKGDDFIVVVGIIDAVAVQTDPVTVARQMPIMDYVTESGNRLWGCRYGTALNGEVVNEIYASKLGDFKNWSCFMGVSTDSYAASCGTDGPFTGAITHGGYPTFWKEGHVHQVYGNFPSNFQIQETACMGVQEGCGDSLAIVNQTLYYKARSGICAFDGALPVLASYALGNEQYSNAVGGAHGNKYYVSMMDRDGGWHLFVYDTQKGMWHKEDDFHALAFESHKGELYAIDGDGLNIVTMLGSGEEDAEEVSWMMETGELGLSSPDMKYISRLILRLMLEPESRVDVYAQYDLSDEWVHLCVFFGTDLRSFSVPIKPRRSDHMKLKLVGKGPAKVYSITKVIEQGSDRS